MNIVVSKIKKAVRDAGFRSSTEFINALNARVDETVAKALEKVRTGGTTRRTLSADDIN